MKGKNQNKDNIQWCKPRQVWGIARCLNACWRTGECFHMYYLAHPLKCVIEREIVRTEPNTI